ncbi:putative aluminum-activated malate transporter [Helianthus annuus]|nr:putative aluminum-activated malate transporter [Helianthus annuus]
MLSQEHLEFQDTIKEPFIKMSSEVGKALKELASSLKLMIYPSSSATHIKNCIRAVDELNATLQASMILEYDILETIPVIATTSVLVEIIKCVETIYEAIEELSIHTNFKLPQNITSDTTENPQFLCRGSLRKPVEGGKDEGSITITVLSDDVISQESYLDKSKQEIN